MKDDRLYLIHITECIQRIRAYIKDGKESFRRSSMVQDAVIRNLQTLAESSQRISSALKAAHPEIDWRGIAGFRNVVVHDYLGLDVENVWEIVERDVPDLQRKIEALLKTINPTP